MTVINQLTNKIIGVTGEIQTEFPELYVNLSETPLLISYTKKEIAVADFVGYLESIKLQLAQFENAYDKAQS